MIKIPNCVVVQSQSNGRSVSSFSRSPLSEKPGNASRKKDFRFPTKEQTGFQIEKAEQCCALEAEHHGHRRHRRTQKEPERLYFLLILPRERKKEPDEPERYMLNMRFPPQSCLIVLSCSEKGWISFRWWRRGKDFY